MNDTWRVPGYAEVDVLGTGGFGRVVLAKHEDSGKMAAIKYLHADFLADARIVAGFRHEAWMLSGVRSPHVVRLFDFVETPQGAALVMEAVPGVSLRALLAAENVLAPEAALTILKGSLLGLADAHAAGVVHRDYKPANVLVSREGASKLVDFGLATLDGHNGLTAGSPSYMAPEQWAGQPGLPATDVYAATCVFYQCITGHRPFEADTSEQLRAMHGGASVPLEAVPEALRPLIARGMAKDPAWRPATAAAFVTELETVARKAYGKNWEKRGWKRLATSAAALTALTPLALLTSAGTAAAPIAAAGAGTGVTAGTGVAAGTGTGVATSTGAGVTATVVGKIAIAVVVVAGLVAGGLVVFRPGDDPPAPPPLTVAMQTLSGRDQALPISYELQYPQVSGGTDAGLRQRVNDALRAPIDKRLKSVRDGVAVPSTLDMFRQQGETAALHSSARILLQTPDVLSVRYDHDLDSTVLGHTTWRFPEAFSVDLTTGKVLGPKDMFRSEILTAVGMRRLTQRLEPQVGEFCTIPTVDGYPTRKATMDAADMVGGGDHVPASTFGFTETGAEFEIRWYELGCASASGSESVALPYAELQDLLLPKFLTMLGKTAAAPTSQSTPGQPGTGATYTNARFGFTTQVPPGYAALKWTPENGEGMSFIDDGFGATLTVWGTNSGTGSGGLSPAAKMDQLVTSLEGNGGRVTVHSADSDGYTVSGYQGDGKVYYEHESIGTGSTAGLRWVYPAEYQKDLGKLVTDTVSAFKPGDLSRPH
ncbi:serine/threonine-protein kinase [Amycolatopsis saalfeldensis]|uniref:Serine/threonine protein kinase n=1 Tax=Amycolatopsis saalfeldensis TaxID=394193 RepID=A0A1H8T8Y7_9PSEU|nr:serine/threonine-protein kinase [Amycolatopsis saalfeldensis]SEO87372.1 serine/threonine protein kinase [Amycolatopsis saalfeldensis]